MTKVFSGECECSNMIYMQHAQSIAMKRAMSKLDDFNALLKSKRLKVKRVSQPKTKCVRTSNGVVFTIVMNVE